MTITRARYDPQTKAYLARTEAEGKTKKGALRCLKRRLARRFHYLLSLPAEAAQRDATQEPSNLGTAPSPMICLT